MNKELAKKIKEGQKALKKQQKELQDLENEAKLETASIKIKNLLKRKKFDEAIKVIEELKKISKD